jgi:ubiquinone/menaquinone biosynthesis C-methylase UbiE
VVSVVNLYESPALRAVTGPVIRPGGFELTDRGLACCQLARGARVLDIGCGAAAAVDHLRCRHGLSAAGLDFSLGLLAEARKSCGHIPLLRGRAEQLPAASAAFDAVLCECVLSLCPEPDRVLREIRRILIPGGHLIISDVYARGPAVNPRMAETLIQCCLQGAVGRLTTENRLSAAGFKVMLWEDHTPLLKRLAAQMIWTYGSLDAFWSAVAGPDAARAMNRHGCGRPGYYLMVAKK